MGGSVYGIRVASGQRAPYAGDPLRRIFEKYVDQLKEQLSIAIHEGQ
jgi:hypothetical protein